MKIVTFNGPQEQAVGLLRYPKVPRGTFFFFPNVTSHTLTTVGLKEPIRVVFLNAAWMVIALQGQEISGLEYLIGPGRTLSAPPETLHVIESCQLTPILPLLGQFLKTIGAR